MKKLSSSIPAASNIGPAAGQGSSAISEIEIAILIAPRSIAYGTRRRGEDND